jgi:hypothetical protein
MTTWRACIVLPNSMRAVEARTGVVIRTCSKQTSTSQQVEAGNDGTCTIDSSGSRRRGRSAAVLCNYSPRKATMSNPDDQLPASVASYSGVRVLEPGIVVGGKDPAKHPDLAVYPSMAQPRLIENVKDAEAWHSLLDQITTQLSQRFPDCGMSRSPELGDSRADWQLCKSHPSGFRLVLECVATRRGKTVHVDCRRFVWLPLRRYYVLRWVIMVCCGFLALVGFLARDAASPALMYVCGGLAVGLYYMTPFNDRHQAVTPEVDSQSQSMFVDAAQSIADAAEDF